MGINLRLFLLLFSIIWLLIIFICLQKNKLPIKYSLVWISATLVLLLISIFPSTLDVIANFFGFMTVSNLVIGVILTLLLLITLVLTMIVAKQKKQITLLIQEVSMIKNK